ncbi:MAG: TFIIB-type zinc finger domain-containing protein [Synechococcus sp.]|nr:TFIIB-type zinc finger domain-containing protein [Synechococcus sp.]
MASVCSQCGSRSWRADRSLAGRLVCRRCGAPEAAAGRRSPRVRPGPGAMRFRVRWWWWLLLGLVFVLILQLL